MPGLRFVDATSGVLGIEWVNGKSVRYLLGSGDEGDEVDCSDEDQAMVDEDPVAEYQISKGKSSHSYHLRTLFSHGSGPDELMAMVGTEIAKMHLADIIHGDLTTSNMMLRHPSSVGVSPQEARQLVREHCSLIDLD